MPLFLDPEDVIDYDLVDTSSPDQPIDLSAVSLVHTLFQKENFTRDLRFDEIIANEWKITDANGDYVALQKISQETFDRIEPALQLATLFVRHSVHFLYTVRFAPILDDAPGANGRQRRYFQRINSVSPMEIQQLQTRLIIMAQRYRFITGIPGPALNAHAVTGLTPPSARRAADPTAIYHVTAITGDVFKLVASPTWSTLHHSIRRRILFQLALTLVHEVAHAVYQDRNFAPPHPYEDRRHEVYYEPTEPEHELGYAWEHWWFGGMLDLSYDGVWSCQDVMPDWRDGSHTDLYPAEWQRWAHTASAGEFSPFVEPPHNLVIPASIEDFFDPEKWEAYVAWTLSSPTSADGCPFQIALSPLKTMAPAMFPRDGEVCPLHARILGRVHKRFLDECAVGHHGIDAYPTEVYDDSSAASSPSRRLSGGSGSNP